MLTAAQAVLGFAILADLRFNLTEALFLVVTFALQFPFPETHVRLFFSVAYLAVAAVLLSRKRRELGPLFSSLAVHRRP